MSGKNTHLNYNDYKNNKYFCNSKYLAPSISMKKKRLIKLILIVIFLLAAALWIKSRYNVWFGNSPEPPYSPLPQPGRVMLTFGDEDGLSRNVNWQCDSVVVPSHLLLVNQGQHDTLTVTAQGEVFQSRGGKMAYYTVRLRNLQPGQNYSYQVHNGSKHSDWYDFKTQSLSETDNYAFIYVGDVQDTLQGKAGQFLRESIDKHADTQFMVFGGDLAERPMDKYWNEVFNELDSIRQHYPILNIAGNHDYLKGINYSYERRLPLIFSYFLDSAQNGNLVYTVKYNNLQLFLLDTTRPLSLWKQKQWLKNALENSTARWKIVVVHHPLFSIRGKYNNYLQRLAFNSLIKEYGVDLILQGHEHAYARMTNKDESGTLTTPVYTISHCSPKNYQISFDDRFDRYGISSRYYQRIHIHKDTLTMVTYDVNTQQVYDSLDIVKPGTVPTVIDYGKDIPEYLEYTPTPGKKKDLKFQERIETYKQQIKQNRATNAAHTE